MQPTIISPHHDLENLIKAYWILESPKSDTPEKNTIVPDGCMKLIFHYRDTYRYWIDQNKSILLPRYFLIGQLTGPYVVEPVGDTGTFIVCFHPNGLVPFLELSLKSIENTAIPLVDVFGTDGTTLGDAIINAVDSQERVMLLEKFLFTYLMQHKNIDKILNSALDTLLSSSGTTMIDTLSKNRRQLERKFSKNIGLSPKQLSKIVRLQAVLKSLLSNSDVNFAQIAQEHDYYDQAHFIKDFNEFTGVTPREFYGDDLKMSLIFESRK